MFMIGDDDNVCIVNGENDNCFNVRNKDYDQTSAIKKKFTEVEVEDIKRRLLENSCRRKYKDRILTDKRNLITENKVDISNILQGKGTVIICLMRNI